MPIEECKAFLKLHDRRSVAKRAGLSWSRLTAQHGAALVDYDLRSNSELVALNREVLSLYGAPVPVDEMEIPLEVGRDSSCRSSGAVLVVEKTTKGSASTTCVTGVGDQQEKGG